MKKLEDLVKVTVQDREAKITFDALLKTNDGTGTGVFTSNLTSLLPNTLYYVRAYATNSVGTAYGNQVSFTTWSTSINQKTKIIDLSQDFRLEKSITIGNNKRKYQIR